MSQEHALAQEIRLCSPPFLLITTHEVRTHEVRTHEVTTHEVTTHEVRTREVTTHEVRTREVRTREVRTREVTTHEVRTREVRTREVMYVQCLAKSLFPSLVLSTVNVSHFPLPKCDHILKLNFS